jgi:predicted dehydrogenase
MGIKHSLALKKMGVDIEAVCDLSTEAAARYLKAVGGDDGGIGVFTDFDVMLASTAAELLIIALPPFAQQGQFEKGAAAGKHIYIEKPIALDPDRGAAMVRAARENGILTGVGFHMRRGAVVRRLRELIDSGRAGRPVLFNARYACNSLHTPWWRQRDKSGGQILEQVIHLYDMSRYLMGEPLQVSALMNNICHKEIPDYTVEDVSSSLALCGNGALSTISATNCAVPGLWQGSFNAVFEHLTVECGDADHGRLVFTGSTPVETETIAETGDNHAEGLRAFVGSVAGNRMNGCDIEEGYRSLVYAAAASASAARQGRITAVEYNIRGENR